MTGATPSAETLGDDTPRSRRVPVALGVLLAVVLLGLGGDHLLRVRETDALLTRTAAATATARYADGRVLAVVTYASPQLFAADTPAGVRAGLVRLVQDEAGAQQPRVDAAADRVGAVRVLPWHGGLRAARAAVVAHVRARGEGLARASQDGDALFAVDPAVRASSRAAREALLAVVSGPDAPQRVDAALAGR